jgi:hypothetical protein
MKATLVLALVTVAAATIMTATVEGAAGTAKAQPFAVTSSLDGKSVLPRRIHWIARVQVASSKVKNVDFLIDGRLGWVEHKPPYVYASDGNWLVTSFLSPGTHTFAVRLVAADGTKSIDTVRARVVASPAPPEQLSGSWQRTVTADDVRKATSGQPPPPGLWKIAIRSAGWFMTDPQGGGGTFDVAYLAATRLQMRPTIEKPPFPNSSNGGFCDDTDPLWTWAVVVSSDGKTMSLDPTGHDRCGDRAAILQGTWSRSG